LRKAISVLSLVLMAAPITFAQSSKYALQLYHFNIQYVAGGLRGFGSESGEWDQYWNDDIEDLIVTESFEPLLDLFLSHPSWGADFEMQGYFLKVLEERHPAVLEKLKTLVTRGQIDLVSFHYSDQLFLAYSKDDMESSIAMTDDIASSLEISISPVVFCQEGQAGPGAIEFAADLNRNIYVYPKNLYKYQYGDWDNAPFYEHDSGAYVLFGPKGASWDDPPIQVTWTFLNDGELLATGGWDPYIVTLFTYKPEAVAEYEAELEDLESQGYKIASISDFVSEVLSLGYEPPACPPLLDGVWQPDDTRNIQRWMGGLGLFWPTERDNVVLTLNAAASAELKVAETLLDWAKSEARADFADLDDLLDEAKRILVMGQVSDSTGWNPWQGEVEYSIARASYSLALAAQIEREVKGRAGISKLLWIDVAANEVSEERNREDVEFEACEPPDGACELEIESPCRSHSASWEVGELDSANLWRVTISFDEAKVGEKCEDPQLDDVIKAKFTWDGENIVFHPALSDEILEADASEFSFEEFALPLPNGWIQASDGLQLIKDLRYVHVAANLMRNEGQISFEDETAARDRKASWVFYLYEGSPEKADRFADQLNIYPEVQR